ncbi:tRNA (adenosine(37)-N6)-dimethylallyltransferase MiaA [Cyclobacteriaceae bacterium]|nr:tRNA (adenosine(37)-N6)-dimethylallyltransferase MiaA [Cyclobacteriaceae bacterium]
MAREVNGEIISADSRQVYKHMNIGTGKDLDEYQIDNYTVPHHLIDICEPGTKYLLPDFQHDFKVAFDLIIKNQNLPIVCGGTGLYIEAIIENHQYTKISENTLLREQLKEKEHQELLSYFASLPSSDFYPDLSTKKRTIRAIEIGTYLSQNTLPDLDTQKFKPIIFGLDIDRNLRREKISNRLKERLDNGLIEEVENLLKQGVSSSELKYYGLEYKYVTEFIEGIWDKESLFNKLEIAIHQFAKRQMTWFRRMETKGHKIHWLNAIASTQENIDTIKSLI